MGSRTPGRTQRALTTKNQNIIHGTVREYLLHECHGTTLLAGASDSRRDYLTAIEMTDDDDSSVCFKASVSTYGMLHLSHLSCRDLRCRQQLLKTPDQTDEELLVQSCLLPSCRPVVLSIER